VIPTTARVRGQDVRHRIGPIGTRIVAVVADSPTQLHAHHHKIDRSKLAQIIHDADILENERVSAALDPKPLSAHRLQVRTRAMKVTSAPPRASSAPK
jgi:hypothetical protein